MFTVLQHTSAMANELRVALQMCNRLHIHHLVLHALSSRYYTALRSLQMHQPVTDMSDEVIEKTWIVDI